MIILMSRADLWQLLLLSPQLSAFHPAATCALGQLKMMWSSAIYAFSRRLLNLELRINLS